MDYLKYLQESDTPIGGSTNVEVEGSISWREIV